MRKRIIGVALVLAALTACTPEETYYWDAVNGKPHGTTAEELCKADPYGNAGLCPSPAAADTYSTNMPDDMTDEYDAEYPNGTPNDWEKETLNPEQ